MRRDLILILFQDDVFTQASSVILKLRKEIEELTTEKDEEINRLKDELKNRSGDMFSPMCSSSLFNQSNNISHSLNFPTNEASFNETIEKSRIATKKINFLKEKLR